MVEVDPAAEEAADALSELQPDGNPFEPGPEQCPYCGEIISESRRELHADGLDARALACSHQDVEAIAERKRIYGEHWARMEW